MAHLDDHALATAVEGEPETAAAAHLAACPECGSRVRELRDLLLAVASVDVPEPSPLFWDHFPARVSRALDETATPARWFTPERLALLSAAAAVVMLVMFTIPAEHSQVNAPAAVPVAAADDAPAVETATDDLDADEAWALVRSVAEDFGYEEARDAGLAPRPGSIETAAMELSADERAELARLIEQEMKRTGA